MESSQRRPLSHGISPGSEGTVVVIEKPTILHYSYDPFRYSSGRFGKQNVVYIYEGSRRLRHNYDRRLEGGCKRSSCVCESYLVHWSSVVIMLITPKVWSLLCNRGRLPPRKLQEVVPRFWRPECILSSADLPTTC